MWSSFKREGVEARENERDDGSLLGCCGGLFVGSCHAEIVGVASLLLAEIPCK